MDSFFRYMHMAWISKKQYPVLVSKTWWKNIIHTLSWKGILSISKFCLSQDLVNLMGKRGYDSLAIETHETHLHATSLVFCFMFFLNKVLSSAESLLKNSEYSSIITSSSNVISFYAEFVPLETKLNMAHVLISRGWVSRLKQNKMS